MKCNVVLVIFLVGVLFLVSADIISINSGGSEQIIINHGGDIEGFFNQDVKDPLAGMFIMKQVT